MIDLVLVKRDMLQYVQDVRAVRGMGRDLSDHHVVLRKVRKNPKKVWWNDEVKVVVRRKEGQ